MKNLPWMSSAAIARHQQARYCIGGHSVEHSFVLTARLVLPRGFWPQAA
jgi:hypothetical protein